MVEVTSDIRIRNVCQRLANENDPGKIEKLARELRRAVDNEQDEARLRMRFIARHYRERLRSAAGHSSRNNRTEGSERASQLRAVMAFLGIGTKMSDGGQTEH